MKTAAFALASLLALATALPAANDAAECSVESTSTSSCTTITSTVLATNVASVMATLTSATVQASGLAGTNVQKFTGTLGGPPPPVISSAGDRPFSVNGDTFVGVKAALGRSCDVQHNACANAANSGQVSGGVSQCDQQNSACHAANSLKRRQTNHRQRRDVRPAAQPQRRDGLDLGSCSNAAILFEAGLDGRSTEAFIAANQQDFNHGSALNVAVIAGFICQRLGSPCGAPAVVQASCTSASAAAVATSQNQAAADAFNAVMAPGGAGAGAGGSGASGKKTTTSAAAAAAATDECPPDNAAGTTAKPALASTTSDAVVMTITSCA